MKYTPFKRVLDVVLAVVLLPIAVPVCLLAAIAIRLESPGNPMFLQRRVGKHEWDFTCLKLRTMFANTVDAGSHEVSKGAVTKLGRILRKTKVDELPQLINVLRGEMSFVGPRPGLPVQQDLTEARRAQGVYDVLPGITGLGQIRKIDMSTPVELAKVDREYIDNQSLILDLKLIAMTALGRGNTDPNSKQG